MSQKKQQQEEQEFINIFETVKEQKQQNNNKLQKHLRPEPLADPKFTQKIMKLLQQLNNLKQIKKGVNQILRAITKSSVQVVILAADCDPLEIVMTLPPLCEQKNIHYCFVSSKAALGRACGIKTPVVAAGLLLKEGSQLTSQIMELKDKIEQLFI